MALLFHYLPLPQPIAISGPAGSLIQRADHNQFGGQGPLPAVRVFS